MDGSLAVLFLVVGLADMGFNYCDTGCLAPQDDRGRGSLSFGNVIFQGDDIGDEIYGRYALPQRFGPFQPILGASVTDQGSAWVGFGAAWTGEFANDRLYVELSLMPGLYAAGDGPDLGSPLEFRSGIEIGYQAPAGWRVGLSADHRSNADIVSTNPGLETVHLRVSIPTN